MTEPDEPRGDAGEYPGRDAATDPGAAPGSGPYGPAGPPPPRQPAPDPAPPSGGYPPPAAGPGHPQAGKPRRSRKPLVITIAVVVVVAAVAAVGGYAVLHTRGTPTQAATTFLTAWSDHDTTGMHDAVADPSGMAAAYQQVDKRLGVHKTRAHLTGVTEHGDTATAAFTATLTLASVGDWTYHGSLKVIKHDHRWTVDWSPAAIHHGLTAGRTLDLKASWPKRGAITAADGSRLDTASASGSEKMLTGYLGPATAKQATKLGAPYAKGDTIGHGGIQQQLETRLAGRPATHIRIVDAGNGAAVSTVGTIAGHAGRSVKTSLDPRVQQAAAGAIIGQHKPTALVAIRPSSGQILAVANVPGGYNRALLGSYPPGSTFKVVTALALEEAGVTPDTTVQCPGKLNIGGQVIHNAEKEKLGAITFHKAFADSCNTAFAGTAIKKLSGAKLVAAAKQLGFDTPMPIGVPAGRGKIPAPSDSAELGTSAFGQGRVTANPMIMAAVAAAVDNGTWRPPTLVVAPRPSGQASPHKLPSGTVKDLRAMMHEVVTDGTATHAGLPSGTAGKTGTAEYGSGPKPPTHAWFIGYRGDLAFAVIVEGGGFGAKAAAPIAAHFLKELS